MQVYIEYEDGKCFNSAQIERVEDYDYNVLLNGETHIVDVYLTTGKVIRCFNKKKLFDAIGVEVVNVQR